MHGNTKFSVQIPSEDLASLANYGHIPDNICGFEVAKKDYIVIWISFFKGHGLHTS